ncbi:hypothetical protein UlMin_000363 [Ulmus minor]
MDIFIPLYSSTIRIYIEYYSFLYLFIFKINRALCLIVHNGCFLCCSYLTFTLHFYITLYYFHPLNDLLWLGVAISCLCSSCIDFTYYANVDLLIAFHCDCQVSHRYKYKFLKATTSNIPSSVIRDNRGSKLPIGRGELLKVQHLVLVSRSSTSHTHIDSASYQPPSRIAYIEFFVKREEDEGTADD